MYNENYLPEKIEIPPHLLLFLFLHSFIVTTSKYVKRDHFYPVRFYSMMETDMKKYKIQYDKR
jgi:hypothetical protein